MVLRAPSTAEPPDPNKARWWTAAQATAWIAFRSQEALRAVARYEAGSHKKDGTPQDPLFMLLAAAAKGDVFPLKAARGGRFEQNAPPPDKTMRAAMSTLKALRRHGLVERDSQGRFRSSDIRRYLKSSEGRGRGQTSKPLRHSKIVNLGLYFAANSPAAKAPITGAFEWSRDEALVTNARDFNKLRMLALEWAENELETRKKYNFGLMNAAHLPDGSGYQPLSPADYKQHKQNLAAWRKVFSPR